MPTVNIPITLQISIMLPDGFALGPQAAPAADPWQYTSVTVAEPQTPQPQVVASQTRVELRPPADSRENQAVDDPSDEIDAMARFLDFLAQDAHALAAEESPTDDAAPEADLASEEGASERLKALAAQLQVRVEYPRAPSAGVPATEPEVEPHPQPGAEREPVAEPAAEPASTPENEIADTALEDHPVTPLQHAAIVQLVSGASIAKAARAIGVNRRTLQRWKREDAGFQLAYQAYRNEVLETAENRLQSMSGDLVGVIQYHLSSGSLAAAMQLAKGLGILAGRRPPRDREEE